MNHYSLMVLTYKKGRSIRIRIETPDIIGVDGVGGVIKKEDPLE